VIDFHCHLDLYPNPEVVCGECEKRGLYVLCMTTTPSAWSGTSRLLAGAKHLRPALGLHPQLAHERQTELRVFDRYLAETRYVGEIGLDGAPEFRAQWQVQEMIFGHILAACQQVGGRILSIHSRRAAGAVLDFLERFPGAGVPILHWFFGSRRDLARAIDLGCWFSVGPAMLLHERGRELTALMPKDRLLTESDGPFAQVNGVSLLPWQVTQAVEDLAALWVLPAAESNSRLHENLKRLLGNTGAFNEGLGGDR